MTSHFGRLERRRGPFIDGFSLIEILVVTAIVAIGMATAMPMVTESKLRESVSKPTSLLRNSITIASNLARDKHRNVTICPSKNLATCIEAGSGTDPNWEDGWIVFFDNDADGTTSDVGGEDDVLEFVQLPIPDNIEITSNPKVYAIQFDRSGEQHENAVPQTIELSLKMMASELEACTLYERIIRINAAGGIYRINKDAVKAGC